MFYAGLDLSRKRVDVEVRDVDGVVVAAMAAPPGAGGLSSLVERLSPLGPVQAANESMNGALAPLACKTDKIDAGVLAELCRRALVPAVWLADPSVRAERERARFRLHLVRHRVALKNRVHASLIAFGKPCPVADLFGVRGRELLRGLSLPEPWAGTVEASLLLNRRPRPADCFARSALAMLKAAA